MQDLQCRKCGGVKELNMDVFCGCAGKFRPTQPVSELTQLLKTFKGIAGHYGMPLLKEMVEDVMRMNGME